VWSPVSDCVEPSFRLCGAQFQVVWSPVSGCVEPSFRLCGAQFQFVWSPVSDCVEPSFRLCVAQFQIVCSPVSDCVEPSFRLCGAQFQVVWSPVSARLPFCLSPSTAAKLLSDFHKFNIDVLYRSCLTSISFVTVGALTLMLYLGAQMKC